MKKLLTVKIIKQINGLYTLQAFDGVIMVREERNLDYDKAVLRIEEIKGERNAVKQGTGTE